MVLEHRGLDPRPGQQVFGIAVAELAILGRLANVEVDVSPGFVRESLVDQGLVDRDDFADVLGRARHVVDPVDPKRSQAFEVVAGDPLGQLVDGRSVFLSLHDQLVVDVGDIHDPRRLVAEVERGSA